jgi:hypothetical protein
MLLTKEHGVYGEISSVGIHFPISGEFHVSMSAICQHINPQCRHLQATASLQLTLIIALLKQNTRNQPFHWQDTSVQ